MSQGRAGLSRRPARRREGTCRTASCRAAWTRAASIRPAGRHAATCGALVLALVAGACQPPRPAGSSDAALPPLPETLDGFRSDAWFLPDDPELGFVDVPAGPFTTGSDPAVDPRAFENERWSRDRAQGTVDLPTFAIGRYEVTVAQFRAFADEAGVSIDAEALRGAPDLPVGSVSWPDALSYCRWLEATLRDSPGTPPLLRQRLADGWRVTLPTEVQWEKAARGTDGRIYPWGNGGPRGRANFSAARPGDGGGAAGPTPVGTYDCPECPFGLRDMSGNVWELTRSPYQPYPYDEEDDASDLDADALFVMRGGSFVDPAANVRAAIRGGADPGVRRPFIGFRVVMTPP
ncbi:MAG: formylglycine-generating enzyme family protein [Acidobacteria bacterium]|nr:formylglycine-generating enzyme family protein [Acidobacteriota bacterium]